MKNDGKKQRDLPIPIIDEDCERPACADTVSMLQSAMARVNKQRKATSKEDTNPVPVEPKMVEIECPPGKEAIGSSTWTLVS
jgi:hypothetical protein